MEGGATRADALWPETSRTWLGRTAPGKIFSFDGESRSWVAVSVLVDGLVQRAKHQGRRVSEVMPGVTWTRDA
jgi:hypothetical protein